VGSFRNFWVPRIGRALMTRMTERRLRGRCQESMRS
jgi:hypothetical protein